MLLQKDPDEVERSLPKEFITDLTQRFENDGLEEVKTPFLFSSRLSLIGFLMFIYITQSK